MSKILGNLRGDRVIWVIVILLSIFSLLTVYSSTGTLAYKYQSGNTEYYMMKHLIILLFGFLIMYLTHLIKFTYFSRIFQIALYIAVPLLILTLFVGLDLNEAKRVLPLPFNLTFQTSDLAKLTLILYLARLLSKKQDNIKDFKSAFLPLMIPVLIVCILILPANFSTAAMLFVTSLVLMFIGRVNLKYIFSLIGIGIVSFVFLLLIANAYPEVLPRANTWKTRIVSFMDKENIDPDKNYQVEQAKIAIAEGGLIGKFPGNSTQRNFLPHPYSDFIFAIFLEEYGLAGGSFLVLLYMILFYRVVRIVTRIPRNFGAFMAVGLGFSLVFQAMINMAVAVNLIPVTGQPLPLISMGGTSIWFTSISLGVILSVSREIDTTPEKIEDYVTA
ncbi:MAG: FtsW/RodA/SpoVE family cell cycle protein [Bacteroidetes bacterium]|nr:FtsW/RodA/SpoVE family cell cycle protein [Bacteroidota bacterium]MCK5765482.1 FtsW/RodA/SpoVE family cell cycle protein [Bacteroidales bacterium]